MNDVELENIKIEKKDIKKWVKALRSGEYSQCQDQLQRGDSFCCLGVACQVFVKHPITQNGTLKGMTPAEQIYAPRWLKEINEGFAETVGDNSFMIEKLNDIERLTFDEIADCLEAVYIHEVLL